MTVFSSKDRHADLIKAHQQNLLHFKVTKTQQRPSEHFFCIAEETGSMETRANTVSVHGRSEWSSRDGDAKVLFECVVSKAEL